MNQYSTYQVDAKTRVNSFIQGVYLWMAVALAISGVLAWSIGTNLQLLGLFVDLRTGGITPLWIGCAVVELGLVFFFSMRLNKISAATATIVFVVYSALSGITLSPIFIVYARTSITSVFFICAATFAVSSLFGFVTKRDLTGMGNFLLMGLIGIIIATVVNIFMKSYGLHMIIGYIGVIVFVGLTAYDTQKMKNMALTIPDDVSGSVVRKASLNMALALYLDFINLFLMLLRILGSRN